VFSGRCAVCNGYVRWLIAGGDARISEARLDEIAESIANIAPVVRSTTDGVLSGEIPLERAESITRSAEVLLGLWELEAEILRRVRRR